MTRRSFFQRAATGALTVLAAAYAPGLAVKPARYKLRAIAVAGQIVPIPDSVPELSRDEVNSIVCEMIRDTSKQVTKMYCEYFYGVSPPLQDCAISPTPA